MANDLIQPLYDTSPDQEVSISIDLGIIPAGYPNAGQHVITLQAHPIRARADAERILQAMKEAVGSRLGISMDRQRGIG